jgi:hypothetical protein
LIPSPHGLSGLLGRPTFPTSPTSLKSHCVSDPLSLQKIEILVSLRKFAMSIHGKKQIIHAFGQHDALDDWPNQIG